MTFDDLDTPVVVLLTDHADLDNVTMLDGTPPKFAVQFTAPWGEPRAMIGTEAQLTRHRDMIDEAISHARLLRVGKPA